LDVVPAPDADVDDGATSSQPLLDAASLHDVEVEPQRDTVTGGSTSGDVSASVVIPSLAAGGPSTSRPSRV